MDEMLTMPTIGAPHVPSIPEGVDPEAVKAMLVDEPMTTGYKATLPGWALDSDYLPQVYLIRDIELMRTHPMVLSSLDYFKAGLYGAEIEVECMDPIVAEYIQKSCDRFWERGVPKLQGGYDYGWIGCETTFMEEEGLLKWNDMVQFSPRDTFLLTQDGLPVGIRVKNVRNKPKAVDLWMASQDVPAKGVWYAHNPRFNSFYGQSQLFGAWRPWRRLGYKDGAETVIDTGVYRFAFAGPVIRYPEEAVQTAQLGVPATTNDSQGRPRRYARDIARQMGEQIKAGGTWGLPSVKYPTEQGGDYKWSVDFPDHTIDVQALIAYAKYLADQISYGCGVPPELQQAAETGSGYSGRSIPMESFIAAQQKIANALLHLFIEQILKPLVRWNFGEVKWEAKVKSLLQTKMETKNNQVAGAAGAQPGAAQTGAVGGLTPNDPGGAAPIGNMPMLSLNGMDAFTKRIRGMAQQILRAA